MRVLLGLVCLLSSACIAPIGPMERLNNAAYDLNTATRFGRFDIALGHVDRQVQPTFIRQHAGWGKKMRIVDLEVQSVRMTAAKLAEVQLEVSWHRDDETIIRVSQVSQRWEQTDNGWLLAAEHRAGGSTGLFGPPGRLDKDGNVISPDDSKGETRNPKSPLDGTLDAPAASDTAAKPASGR